MPQPVFLRVTRANFIPASVVPFLAGAALAYSRGYDVLNVMFALGLTAVAAAHLGGNALNDYYDHITGADNISVRVSPFFGGSRAIQEGAVSPGYVLAVSVAFLFLSLASAVAIFMLTRDPVFILLMLVASVLTVEYTAPPLRLAYNMLGELDIFLMFGVLLVPAGFYLFSGTFATYAVLLSLPIAFLVLSVIICNEVPDALSDMRAGKKNLLYLTGPEKGHVLYGAAVAFSAITLVINVCAGILPLYALAALLFYVYGLKAFRILQRRESSLEDMVQASALTIRMNGAVGILAVISLFASGM